MRGAVQGVEMQEPTVAPAPAELSVVLPAYNEEANILPTLESVVGYLSATGLPYEVWVIDDGGTDRTQAIVRDFAARHPHVRLLCHPRNLGYGAALCSGFAAATGRWVFFMDADGQFDIRDLGPFLEQRSNHDIVVGFRARRQDHPIRLLNAAGWNWLIRITLGVRVRDVDCAFKLFRAEALRALAPRARGASINAEMLARSRRLGLRLVELPVRHYPRRAGQPTGARLTVIGRALWELARLWFTLRREQGREGKAANELRLSSSRS